MTAEGPADISTESVREWLAATVAASVNLSAADVPVDRHLVELGLDSTETLILVEKLARWTGVEVDPAALWHFPTVSALAEYVVSQGAAATP